MLVKEKNISLDKAAELYLNDKSDENLNKVVNAGKGLIYHFVKIYGVQSFCEDLFQVGTEGLLKALKRFDPEQEVSFATYAGSLIIGEIRHYIRKETAYYCPRTVSVLRKRVDELIDDKFAYNGQIPQMKEIAKSINLREEGISEILKTGLVPLEEIDLSRIASVRHESFKLPVEDRILLEQALNKLTQVQRKVIDFLFFKDMTQSQTAQKLDIHRKKVSRELQKGIETLKKDLL